MKYIVPEYVNIVISYQKMLIFTSFYNLFEAKF